MTPTSTNIVIGNSEASANMQSNVLPYRHAHQRPKADGSAKESAGSAGDGAQAPSTYMLLISRVENMLRRNALDERTLEQLRAYMTSHLGAVSEAGRQSIAVLPEYTALGAEKVADLPETVVRAVRDRERAPAAFALLKQPTFSAYMRDELRARVYGPQGALRAS